MTPIPKSPITGNAAETVDQLPFDRFAAQGIAHPDYGGAQMVISEVVGRSFYDGRAPVMDDGERATTPEEWAGVLILLRSLLWRTQHKLSATVVVCRDEQDIETVSAGVKNKATHRFYDYRTVEGLLREWQGLDFEERCMRTLENVAALWKETKKALELNVYYKVDDITLAFRYVPHYDESGITFATSAEEAHEVFDALHSRGLLKWRNITDSHGLLVSYLGREILDKRQRAGLTSTGVGVFVIQPYDESLNKFLEPIINGLKERLGVSVEPVWGSHHNERIDERIFRRLRECQAVLLHVAGDNFNVGFEAGYALGINKPIVAFRENPANDADERVKRMPFDIATLNCYHYKRDTSPENIKEIVDVLEARLLIELPKKIVR